MLFHCEEDCGLFIGLDKIHPLAQAGKHADGGPPQGHPGSAHSGTSVDQPLAVKKGDRVVVHNKKGVACHGIVRWIGKNTVTREFQFPVAGLVMVRACIPTDNEFPAFICTVSSCVHSKIIILNAQICGQSHS